MNKLFLPCIFFLFSVNVIAQSQSYIKGKITDSETNQPVPGASVFISNSSEGVIADSNGNFILNNIRTGSFNLVFSSIGFQTGIYNFNDKQLPLDLNLKLQKKTSEIQGITISPYDKNGWVKWGDYFLEQFIGTSLNSIDCKLLNPKVLRFRFSAKKNTLSVEAEEPLIIENKALGYRITFQLEKFESNFKNKSFFYLGYPFYEDMTTNRQLIKDRWISNRRRSYEGSTQHFIRALYEGNLQNEGFEVRKLFRKVNEEKERVKLIYSEPILQKADRIRRFQQGRPGGTNHLDSSGYYSSVLRQLDFIDSVGKEIFSADTLIVQSLLPSRFLSFKDSLIVIYTNKLEEQAYLDFYEDDRKPYLQQSMIWLLNNKNAVKIEPNGNYDGPLDIYLSGYWGWYQKLANNLPEDYIYLMNKQ